MDFNSDTATISVLVSGAVSALSLLVSFLSAWYAARMNRRIKQDELLTPQTLDLLDKMLSAYMTIAREVSAGATANPNSVRLFESCAYQLAALVKNRQLQRLLFSAGKQMREDPCAFVRRCSASSDSDIVMEIVRQISVSIH